MAVPQMKGRWYPLLEVMYPTKGLANSWTNALEANRDPTLAFSLMMSSLVTFGGSTEDEEVTFGRSEVDSLELSLEKNTTRELVLKPADLSFQTLVSAETTRLRY